MQNLFSNVRLLFEASWEVCNKIGGIYTVLSTKAAVLTKTYPHELIFMGPNVRPDASSTTFTEDPAWLAAKCGGKMPAIPDGIAIRAGYWEVPGRPQAILVKFDSLYPRINDIYGEMWRNFGVDSLHCYGDYPEGVAFSTACGMVIQAVIAASGTPENDVIAHFDEWTTAAGLLYVRAHCPGMATLFTTHATSIGRSICGNGKPLYDYFEGYEGDQMARELNMEAKHSIEKTAAREADCFTTVSDVTARECEQLLGIRPQVVTPNGFEPRFVSDNAQCKRLRQAGRRRLLAIAEALTGRKWSNDTLIVATSGRNEYRNKGIDLYLDSVARAAVSPDLRRDILALVLVPAWVKEPSASLVDAINGLPATDVYPKFSTHRLNNEDSDPIYRRLHDMTPWLHHNTAIIDIPCYLDGADGVVDIPYYDLLPAIDLTVFASYYEPWGYTPLESIAFGVPTVSTDKAGFGQWILSHFANTFAADGAEIVERTDSNYDTAADAIAGAIARINRASAPTISKYRHAATQTSRAADWQHFITYYDEAFEVALSRRDQRARTDFTVMF